MAILIISIILITAVLLFAWRPAFGLYALAALSFFSGWFVAPAKYEWISAVPFLKNLNAPAVDVMAVLVLAGAALAWFFNKNQIAPIQWRRPPKELLWYLFFIFFSGLSIFFAFEGMIRQSAWYWLRSIVFTYAAYLVFPYLAVAKKKILENTLFIWLVVGAAGALYGLSSLWLDAPAGWTRAHPYSIGGFAPFGLNQNQLAEALAVIVPVAGYFVWRAWQKSRRLFIIACCCFVLISAVCLMTLSRAAWITLAVEAAAALFFYYREAKHLWQKNRWLSWLFGIFILGAAGYMLYFLIYSPVVSSSNQARWDTAQIAIFYAKRSPLFGVGAGMYTQVLAGTRAYAMDYGDPLEAHGFLHKILLENGFLGLSVFIFFLIAVFAHLWRAQKGAEEDIVLSRILFLCVLGGVLFQIFNTEYYSAVMWLPLGLAIAHARLVRPKI